MEQEEFAEVLADLIRGTAVEEDALEVAKLRKLSPDEQLEVSIVLWEAMQQKNCSPELRQESLARVRTIEQALGYLNSSESDRCSTDSLEQDQV
jgi:hypothetical protein